MQYWDEQSATDDGVLGGFGELSVPDLRDSNAFVDRLMGAHLRDIAAEGRGAVAADCGAGIGRVAENVLLPRFAEVDLVEPSRHLLETARKRLPGGEDAKAAWIEWPARQLSRTGDFGAGSDPATDPLRSEAVTRAQAASTAAAAATAGDMSLPGRARQFHLAGLEAWAPPSGRYDLIWMQWALLYLTDDDLVAFLRRAAAALRPGGFLIAKENVTEGGFTVDVQDLSLTRSHAYYLALFAKAGLKVVRSATQRGFPKGLYKVRMYALKP